VVEGGSEVVNSVPDDRPPDLIRRKAVDLQVDGEVPVVAFRLFFADDAVGVRCEVRSDYVIEDVEVFLRPVQLRPDAVQRPHAVTSS
jgi:hypothetical protein